MRKLIGVLFFVLAAGGIASAGVPDSAALERFNETGDSVKCVNMRSVDITAVNDSTFLFKVGTNDYYVNRTRDACNGASSNFTRMEVRLFGTQLCNGETLNVVEQQSGIYRGSCSLGDFQKLQKRSVDQSPTTDQQ